MPPTNQNDDRERTWPGAVGWILAGCLSATLFIQAVLEEPDVAGAFMSRLAWSRLIPLVGGPKTPLVDDAAFVSLPMAGIALTMIGFTMASWLAGSVILVLTTARGWSSSLMEWGSRGWKWWTIPGGWYVLSLLGLLTQFDTLIALTTASVELWWAVAVAGWFATFCNLLRNKHSDSNMERMPGWVIVAGGVVLYTASFTWMNWQLYEGLLVPHGDSAMYEEHLWNLTHGKGFRSYLDQGLFLGEHIQVIHLALLPLYLLWPSHLLLELCESIALATTTIPVYLIAQRHTGSERTAGWLAMAVLLYVPLQYLDIAIDLKTFRPISFGVPLLLLAIDQMERRRWWTMGALLVLTLSAKEDFAIVIAPLGVWLFLTSWSQWRREGVESSPASSLRVSMIVGAAMAVLATVYLALVVKMLIPAFREGDTVHYARYFSRFGETPTEIVGNMLTHPGHLLGEFLTAGTLIYGLRVLIPLGGTPLLSPSRLVVGAPLFLLLCLNELAQETPAPVHHFHAPLLPIVFWASAAGLANVPAIIARWSRWRVPLVGSWGTDARTVATFATLCAMTTGIVVSIHPFSRKFWDAGDAMYWRRLYVPGERAAQFEKILPLIPRSARVASTDFVHPRFTHHDRSYDYSGYLRRVAGYEHRVPNDTDFIVIDTQHPYSTMHVPDDVPEYHQPQTWELLTKVSSPWFIVLKRRNSVEADQSQ